MNSARCHEISCFFLDGVPKAFVCDLGDDSWGPNGGHAMFIDLNNVYNKWNGVWCDDDHNAEKKFICKALSG